MDGGIPILVLETFVMYHRIFCEGWWVIVWWSVYAIAFSEAFRIAHDYAKRKKASKP